MNNVFRNSGRFSSGRFGALLVVIYFRTMQRGSKVFTNKRIIWAAEVTMGTLPCTHARTLYDGGWNCGILRLVFDYNGSADRTFCGFWSQIYDFFSEHKKVIYKFLTSMKNMLLVIEGDGSSSKKDAIKCTLKNILPRS